MITIEVKVEARKDEIVSDLLREATALKEAGDIDGAIAKLRSAYAEIAKGKTDYTINTFLRLPIYLKSAKRNDDAWREFNLLLSKSYPNQPVQPGAREYSESVIYDKMRLFLQREGKNVIAVRYGILSYLSDLRHRFAAQILNESFKLQYGNWASAENCRVIVTRLLKKAKRLEKLDEVSAVVMSWVAKMPDGDDVKVAEKVASILGN